MSPSLPNSTPEEELRDLTLPPEPGDIAFLRTMTKLERISFTEDPNNQYLPDKTAAEFWKEYDAKTQA